MIGTSPATERLSTVPQGNRTGRQAVVHRFAEVIHRLEPGRFAHMTAAADQSADQCRRARRRTGRTACRRPCSTCAGASAARQVSRRYRAGHVPGAVYVDLDTQLAGPPGPGGRHPLPAAADFEAAMRAAGVRADGDVVVYDEADATVAARAWWLLRYFGHGRPGTVAGTGGCGCWTAGCRPGRQPASRSAPGKRRPHREISPPSRAICRCWTPPVPPRWPGPGSCWTRGRRPGTAARPSPSTR